MATPDTEPTPSASDPRSPRPGLVRLWSAVGVSSLGDGAFLSALPLAAAAVTRDPTAVAAVTAAMYLPWVLVQPVAGALLERWPFRTTLLVADGLRAVGVGALAVIIATGTATIPLLAVVAFGMVLGQVFHDGAVQATVPELAGRTGPALDHVNGRVYAADTAGKQLIGPPAGSAAYAAVPWLPFAADAVSFLASAALLYRLPRGLRTPHTADRPPLLAAVWAGMVWLAQHVQLRLLAIIAAAANLAYNCAWATFVLFATDQTGLGLVPAAFGLLMSAYAVGGVVGGLLTRRLNAVIGPAQGVVVLTIGHALAWPLIAVTGSAWAAAPLLAMVGAAQTMTTVTNVGLRQRLAPATMLNRVTASFRTLVNSASPLGAVLGGILASAYGLAAPLFVAGGVLLVITVTAGLPLISRVSADS